MFIELVDDLRCPRPHEETWLVASADRTEGRDVVEGTLGCPICHAEYPIRDGVVWFDPPDSSPSRHDPPRSMDAELAMRLAAFLDLSDAQGFALLAGSWGSAAPLLRNVVPTHVVVLNPTADIARGRGVSVLRIATPIIPLAAATCRGVALDASNVDHDHLAAAVRVLRPRGRLVAPASAPVPGDVTELVRDERLWVAERASGRPEIVVLRGRR